MDDIFCLGSYCFSFFILSVDFFESWEMVGRAEVMGEHGVVCAFVCLFMHE